MRMTSRADPLRVDFIDGSPLPGRLGLTLAPGKKGTSSMSNVHWDRDLDQDLGALVGVHGARTLVSLMEPHEYEMLGIVDLHVRARAVGLRVHSLPICDASVPRTDQLEEFDALVDGLLQELQDGRTVVVHCRGGLGRSGIVAACILTRTGVEAGDAIDLVRRYRKGAVETAAQARFVADYLDRHR